MQLQRLWRIAGLALIGASAVMVWLGPGADVVRQRPVFYAVYWLVFLLLFLGAIYCVLLDIRYIRLQYHLAQRQLVRETMADEALQRALKEAKPAHDAERRE